MSLILPTSQNAIFKVQVTSRRMISVSRTIYPLLMDTPRANRFVDAVRLAPRSDDLLFRHTNCNMPHKDISFSLYSKFWMLFNINLTAIFFLLSSSGGSCSHSFVSHSLITRNWKLASTRTEQHTQNDNHRSHYSWSFLKGLIEYTIVLGKRQPCLT